jgi:transcription initiation factor IIE alpha subunit
MGTSHLLSEINFGGSIKFHAIGTTRSERYERDWKLEYDDGTHQLKKKIARQYIDKK